VGRVGLVDDGRVLAVREWPWEEDVGADTPDYSLHVSIVVVFLGREVSGLREMRVALMSCTREMMLAKQGRDVAATILQHKPHLVIVCRVLEV
jgi:hypothetical protein